MRLDTRTLILSAAVAAGVVGAVVVGWPVADPRPLTLSAAVPASPPVPDIRVEAAPEPPPQSAPEPEPAEEEVVEVEVEVDVVLPDPEPPPPLAAVALPASPEPEPEPETEAARGPLVHLASYYGPRMAHAGWAVLTGSAGAMLADARPELRDVRVRGRHYVRLLARLPEGADAAGRCAELRRAGFYCAVSSQASRSASAR